MCPVDRRRRPPSEFNCALQQKILLQGKLYISQNFACFYSNIFGNETIVWLYPRTASHCAGAKCSEVKHRSGPPLLSR